MQYDLDVLNDFKDVKDLKDFYTMYSFLFPTYAYCKTFHCSYCRSEFCSAYCL